MLAKITLPFVAMVLMSAPAGPDTLTRRPSDLRFEPVVELLTVRLPVVAAQITVNVVVVVLPAVMLTVRGFEVTVQFCATPLSCTEWSPGDSPLIVTVLLMPMALL